MRKQRRRRGKKRKKEKEQEKEKEKQQKTIKTHSNEPFRGRNETHLKSPDEQDETELLIEQWRQK